MSDGGRGMAEKWRASKVISNEEKIAVTVTNKEKLENRKIEAQARMLVDGENLEFIYIIDVEDAYSYLTFPQDLWEELKNAIGKNLPFFLIISEEEDIELLQFQSELQYLLENSKGNSNYGEKFTKAVSTIFQA